MVGGTNRLHGPDANPKEERGELLQAMSICEHWGGPGPPEMRSKPMKLLREQVETMLQQGHGYDTTTLGESG